jgi:hypothetical protein
MFGIATEREPLFGGQYLVVVAELSTLRKPEINFKDCVTFPEDFIHNLDQPSRATIWGGVSKGVIFALLKARAGQPISIVIDINPPCRPQGY